MRRSIAHSPALLVAPHSVEHFLTMNCSMMSTYPGFFCPLTGKIMEDPVVTIDGFTFERGPIEASICMQQQSGALLIRNPITNSILYDIRLIPNLALKLAIDFWMQQQQQQLLLLMPQQQPDLPQQQQDLPQQQRDFAVLDIPTFCLGLLYQRRHKLSVDYQVDIDIEPDKEAQSIGTRKVTVRSLDKGLLVLAEYGIWSLVQKKCFANSMECDPNTGLPYTQLLFSIPSDAHKVGMLLQRHQKMTMERKFRINFLVEKCREKHERTVILTAWNSHHTNVQYSLIQVRDHILSKITAVADDL